VLCTRVLGSGSAVPFCGLCAAFTALLRAPAKVTHVSVSADADTRSCRPPPLIAARTTTACPTTAIHSRKDSPLNRWPRSDVLLRADLSVLPTNRYCERCVGSLLSRKRARISVSQVRAEDTRVPATRHASPWPGCCVRCPYRIQGIWHLASPSVLKSHLLFC
jgi:hypothetical protein